VRGVSPTPNDTRQSAVQCDCQADRSPFARANSRVAVDQTGVGAFLNLARLPSATGNVIQSVVEQKQNTIAAAPADAILQGLNPAQQRAVAYGIGENNGAAPPLLIAAGAGTGKTKTLAHRVARLILGGVDPRRLLLLAFTRRAALEMTRRTQQILAASRGGVTFGVDAELLPWSGTFHSISNRLLRQYAASLALNPAFTVLDRTDSADLMDVVRSDLGLACARSRFPQKGTCLAIYSYTVNAGCPLAETLGDFYPWCGEWEAELKRLFAGYVAAKQHDDVLDYDDLLLYWREAARIPAIAAQMSTQFDHILVDEYQDTNRLQADILLALAPDGAGLTVVGDDAQSIYGFRAATVRNILDFPGQFSPPAMVIALEHNYRSTQPILDAANAVMAGASEGFAKTLTSSKPSAELPYLITVEDETAQAVFIAGQVLEQREAGIELRHQAVLFRAVHHSARLEIELARRNIPFVKYGGLKFIEAAHIKDLLAILRWAENPRDTVAGFRTVQLLPATGPASAKKAALYLTEHRFDLGKLADFVPPAAAALAWPEFCRLLRDLQNGSIAWAGQIGAVRAWYQPHLERLYDYPTARADDLEQLEQIAIGHPSRERFLAELTLEPPNASGANADRPQLDEDYLILSTIHSAKGQEWHAVYILNLVDGCIPSDMATGNSAQIEEERRLLYVAMTRAKEHLYLVEPIKFFRTQQHRYGNGHMFAPRSRFLPDDILPLFSRTTAPMAVLADNTPAPQSAVSIDIGARLRGMWDDL
jgi:DNA helicase II / ATP-dependent DNA helicase PcrA